MEYIYLILPIVSVFGVSRCVKVGEETGQDVAFRPPGWVFGLVWTVLLILFGVSWMIENEETINIPINICYGIVNVLFIAWIIVNAYVDDKKYALWVLFITLMMSLYCYTLATQTSKLMLIPIITWVLFAISMSLSDIIKNNPIQ